MRHFVCLATSLLVACDPPPEVLAGAGGEPSIEITFPKNDSVILLEPDCSLVVPVAVDIDGFIFTDPAEADGLVANEGHMHIESSVNPGNYLVTADKAVEAVLTAEQLFGTGAPTPLTISVSADLVDNEHRSLDLANSFDLVEFSVNPPAEGCTPPGTTP